MSVIIPGILTNSEDDFAKRLEKAESVARLIQVDVIDGQFAPNTTIGIETIKKYPSKSLLEVQLMVAKPSVWIESLIGIDNVYRIIFPFETEESILDNVDLIKTGGKQAGISINPETTILDIADYAKYVDMLCIFSATPGFSGKKLEESVYARIMEAKRLYPNLPLEIDIGVNFETAPKLMHAGADFLVATSTLHNAEDYHVAYQKLEQAALIADN